MSQTQSERIRIDGFARTPYLNVLTYPRLDLKAAASRTRQLGKLGVEEVLFEGRTKIGRLGLVGIGTVSVVVRGVVEGRVHALKIRRMDANRAEHAGGVPPHRDSEQDRRGRPGLCGDE